MTIRVNVKTKVINSAIKREKRNGRDVIIVPSATMPDDVVMNGILYPADEIAKSFKTLERTPAPLGHPVVNGLYVSAVDPDAINGYWVGAYNENVRQEGGRVRLDKVIDVETLESTERGRKLMEAINENEPIHTSTGIFLEPQEAEGEGYTAVATNMLFDHDAILIGEVGAATPEQGVGMMVNSSAQVDVINSELPMDDDGLNIAADILADSFERNERRKKWGNLKEKILNALRDIMSNEPQADGLNVNTDEGDNMPITEEQFKALEAKVDSLAANSDELSTKVEEAVTKAVEPITNKLTELEANAKAQDEAQRATHIEAIVNSGLLEEDEAKELSTNALAKLAAKAKPGFAAPLVGAFNGNQSQDDDYWDKQDLNANIDQGGAN